MNRIGKIAGVTVLSGSILLAGPAAANAAGTFTLNTGTISVDGPGTHFNFVVAKPAVVVNGGTATVVLTDTGDKTNVDAEITKFQGSPTQISGTITLKTGSQAGKSFDVKATGSGGNYSGEQRQAIIFKVAYNLNITES